MHLPTVIVILEDLRAHEEATKVKNIEKIVLGRYEMTTWYAESLIVVIPATFTLSRRYFSPFPEEYNKYGTLYFCEFCLSYFGTALGCACNACLIAPRRLSQ